MLISIPMFLELLENTSYQTAVQTDRELIITAKIDEDSFESLLVTPISRSIKARFTQPLDLFKRLLSNNKGIESVKIVVTEGDEERSFDPWFISSIFSTLNSISVGIKHLHLKLDPFIFSHEETINFIISMIRDNQAFQQLNSFTLECDTYEAHVDPGCDFFIDLFYALPNKASLNELALDFFQLSLFDPVIESEADLMAGTNDNCQRLMDSIKECTSLNTLSIRGNFISDSLLNGLGVFIKDHRLLHTVSVDFRFATFKLGHIDALLQNKRLRDVSLGLMVDGKTIGVLNSVCRRLKGLVGLSKLSLYLGLNSKDDISFAEQLLKSAIENQTISQLHIDIDPRCQLDESILKSISMNKTLIKASAACECLGIHHILQEQTRQNVARQSEMMCLFSALHSSISNEEVAAVNSFSSEELISAQTIWHSLMCSYALKMPEDSDLSSFHKNFVGLVLDQLLNPTQKRTEAETKTKATANIPFDVSFEIATYVSDEDLVSISRTTGGYFFRQKKPLERGGSSAVSSDAIESKKYCP